MKGIKFKKHNEDYFPESLYKIGDLYLTESNENPASRFGGTWELQKTLIGGEMIAYACVSCCNEKTVYSPADTEIAFSDTKMGKHTYTVVNYIDNIFTGMSGTILVNPQDIVGLVEADIYLTGRGGEGVLGFWWKNNFNPLPSGVTLLPNNIWGYLSTGPFGKDNYGGSSNAYYYKVDEGITETFFINPQVRPYHGEIAFSCADTKSHLLVKAYAKKGSTKVWKRTA